ncbi:hypothetical protein RUM43_010774 [Polyplax serrata]|uniref:Uncharacterized protein n=1 Tax=Polyplax serrata TaxID=468196 RepID=A0AAN8PB65_POLSC
MPMRNHKKLYREDSDGISVMSSSQIRIGRRKTDLMPTIPSPREGSNSRPTSGTRSLARTPGRAYSMARLDILAQPRVVHTSTFSQPLSGSSKSMSRSTNHLVESKQFQSNTLAKTDTSKSMVQLHSKGSSLNFIQPRMTRAQRLRNRAKAMAASTKSLSPDGGLSSGDTTPSRPGSVLSQCSSTSASTPAPRMRSTPRRPRPFSIHITGVSKDKEPQKLNSPSEEKITKELKENKVSKPPTVKQVIVKKQVQQKNEETNKPQNIGNNSNVVSQNKINGDAFTEGKKLHAAETIKQSESNSIEETISAEAKEAISVHINQKPSDKKAQNSTVSVDNQNNTSGSTKAEPIERKELSSSTEPENNVSNEDDSSKGNVMSRSKIITEEEAKAALAERRRLAREQAEREAEAERLRLEMEAKMEAERLRKEEEEQRLAEEEQLRLLDEARRIEEDRLMQAIKEAKKREEEERERKQQEEMARLEKEEAERKAREEAERQRVEMAERLKREEEERQARRKRVEAIMKRTRNNPTNSTNKADCEKGEDDGTEHEKDEPKSKLEVFLHGERVTEERSLTNGQTSQDNHKQVLDNLIDNNHSNKVEITTSNLEKEDCLNSNSTLVTPLIAFQGKAKDTPVTANYMA